MQHFPFPRFDVTSEGLIANGNLLAKRKLDGTFSISENTLSKFCGNSFSSQSLRYINRAGELMAKVKDSDWDDRTPHDMNHIPALAQVKMNLALASPQPYPFQKYSSDQPRVPAGSPDGGQWTSGGGGSGSSSDRNVFTGQADLEYKGRNIAYDPAVVTLSDGSNVINPYTGGNLLMPAGVSLENNAQLGEWMATLPSIPTLDNVTREEMMINYFERGGAMDYQRQNGADGLVTQAYIPFGNFNYGVVAAAAGYTYNEALAGAAVENINGGGDRSGQWFSNPQNDYFIQAGYNAYKSGKIKASGK